MKTITRFFIPLCFLCALLLSSTTLWAEGEKTVHVSSTGGYYILKDTVCVTFDDDGNKSDKAKISTYHVYFDDGAAAGQTYDFNPSLNFNEGDHTSGLYYQWSVNATTAGGTDFAMYIRLYRYKDISSSDITDKGVDEVCGQTNKYGGVTYPTDFLRSGSKTYEIYSTDGYDASYSTCPKWYHVKLKVYSIPITTQSDTAACDVMKWKNTLSSIKGKRYNDEYTTSNWTNGTLCTDTLPSATINAGTSLRCDSILKRKLYVFNHNERTDNRYACDSYTWVPTGNTSDFTHTYTTSQTGVEKTFSGKDAHTYSSSPTKTLYCDSVYTLNLTIYKSTSQTLSRVYACDDYTWTAEAYRYPRTSNTTDAVSGNDATTTISQGLKSTSGNYSSSNLYTKEGCDYNLTLPLTVYTSKDTSIHVHACETYDWKVRAPYAKNSSINASQLATLVSSIGDLTAGSEVTYSSNPITTNVNKIDGKIIHIYTKSGCDSAITLTLEIHSHDRSDLKDTICLADGKSTSYTWRGNTFDQAALTAYASSDATVPSAMILSMNGTEEWSSGSWPADLTWTPSAKIGGGTETVRCKKINNLYLRVFAPGHDYEGPINECGSYTWRGTTYNTSNTDITDTVENAVNASNGYVAKRCDSIYHLNLSLNTQYTPASASDDGWFVVDTCGLDDGKFVWYVPMLNDPSQPYDPSTNPYSKKDKLGEYTIDAADDDLSGVYYSTPNTYHMDDHKCDSVFVLQLHLKSSYYLDEVKSCDEYTWSHTGIYGGSNSAWNGDNVKYTDSEIDETFTDAPKANVGALSINANCDSILYLKLRLYESRTETVTPTLEAGYSVSCDQYTWTDRMKITDAVAHTVVAEPKDFIYGGTNDAEDFKSRLYTVESAAAGVFCDSVATLSIADGINLCKSTSYGSESDYKEVKACDQYLFSAVGGPFAHKIAYKSGSNPWKDYPTTSDLVDEATHFYSATAAQNGWLVRDTIVAGNSQGCDSIRYLKLLIKSSTETVRDVLNVCDEYTAVAGSVRITYQGGLVSGTTLDNDVIKWHRGTFPENSWAKIPVQKTDGNYDSGCPVVKFDSINIFPSTTYVDNHFAYDTFTWHGNTYTASTSTPTYTTKMVNSPNNCDSVVTLKLTIYNRSYKDTTYKHTPYITPAYESPIYLCDGNIQNWVFTDLNGDMWSIPVSTAGVVTKTIMKQVTVDGVTDSVPHTYMVDVEVFDNLTTNDTKEVCDLYETPAGLRFDGDPAEYTSDATVRLKYYRKDIHDNYSFAGNPLFCDSIVYVDLTVKHSVVKTTNDTVCDSITLYGTFIDNIGGNTPLSKSITNNFAGGAANGCDSTHTINLIVVGRGYENNPVKLVCDSYIWKDKTYTSDTVARWVNPNCVHYPSLLDDKFQCDSVYLQPLKFGHDNTGDHNVIGCDTYTWIDGNTYTTDQPGNIKYRMVGANSEGCDSVVTLYLQIKPTYDVEDIFLPDQNPLHQHACDVLLWWDDATKTKTKSYTTNNYTDVATLSSVYGCDSVVHLKLTMGASNSLANGNEGHDIQLGCKEYTWAETGDTYTASISGNTTRNTLTSHTNIQGCDSAVYLYLTIKDPVTINDVQTACDSFYWHGVWYGSENTATLTKYDPTNPPSYSTSTVSSPICDSTSVLSLTLLQSEHKRSVVEKTCNQYTWNGADYTVAGTYTMLRSGAASNGCDVHDTLVLKAVFESHVYDTFATMCQPFEWKGYWRWETGVYEYNDGGNLKTADLGACDSTVRLHFTRLHQDSIFRDTAAQVCDNLSWYEHTNITASGVYYHRYSIAEFNTSKCDSLVRLTITVHEHESKYVLEHEQCVDPSPLHAVAYFDTVLQSTTVNPNDAYCPLYTYTVTEYRMNSTYDSSDVACGHYTWSEPTGEFAANHGGAAQEFTTSGIYTDKLTNAAGCDSVITLNLVVNYPHTRIDTIWLCGDTTVRIQRYNNDGTILLVDSVYSKRSDIASANILDDGPLHQGYLLGKTADGCDSLLNIFVHLENNRYRNGGVETVVNACNEYTFHGLRSDHKFTSSMSDTAIVVGTYSNGYKGEVCDSLERLRVNIYHNVVEELAALDFCDSVVWRDSVMYYDSKVLYDTVPLSVESACDSVYKQPIVKHSAVHTSNSAKNCNSYHWTNVNGADTLLSGFTGNRTVVYNYTSVDGCESSDTLHIELGSRHHQAYTVSTCDSFRWVAGDNMLYNASGDYTYKHTGDDCDYTDTLHLTIYHHHIMLEDTACAPYHWSLYGRADSVVSNQGVMVTTNTYRYTYEYTDAFGKCADTLVLHYASTAIDTSVCDSLRWDKNATLYTATGTYKYAHVVNTVGGVFKCNAADTLKLTVNKATHKVEYKNDACDSYTWNNSRSGHINDYTATGIYIDSYTNADGCPSADTLHLRVQKNTDTILTVSVCEQYVNFDTTFHASTSSFVYHTVNKANCDSTIRLHLTVKYNDTISSYADVCDTFRWEKDGNFYSYELYPGTSKHATSYGSSNGCTTFDTLHLTLRGKSHASRQIHACNEYTWTPRLGVSRSTTVSTVWTDTVEDKNLVGCDSIVTLKITIHSDSSHKDVRDSICDSYVWKGHPVAYSAEKAINGEYRDTLVHVYPTATAYGCEFRDSLVFAVHRSVTGDTLAHECDSFDWYGATYTVSTNSPQHTYKSIYGCDSVVTLHLTIPEVVVTDAGDRNLCANESFVWNLADGHNRTYYGIDGSRVVYDTLKTTRTVNGCDSIVSLNVIVNAVSTGVDMQEQCDSYRWSIEDLDGKYHYYGTSMVTAIRNSSLGTMLYSSVDAAAKTYDIHIKNAAGCDSTVYLNLVMHHKSDTTYNDVTACDSLRWSFDNVLYTTTGNDIAQHTAKDQYGCDSTIHLNLTILHDHNDGMLRDTSCGVYTWTKLDGTELKFHGTDTITLSSRKGEVVKTVEGCDSIVTLLLHVDTASKCIATDWVKACEKYTWRNDSTYTTSTDESINWSDIYVGNRPAPKMCDTTYNLGVKIYRMETLPTQTLVACDSALFNGKYFTMAGVGIKDTVLYTGSEPGRCDTIATLNITLQHSHHYDTVVPGYSCDSLHFVMADFGLDTVFAASVAPTDSIYHILPAYGGLNKGCDSTITITLDVHNVQHNLFAQSVCDTLSVVALDRVRSITLAATGSNDTLHFGHVNAYNPYTHDKKPYVDTQLYAYNDGYCPSVDTFCIKIYPNAYDTISDTACNEYEYGSARSSKWFKSGDALLKFATDTTYEIVHREYNNPLAGSGALLCDSIHHLNVTIHTDSIIDSVVKVCDAFTWFYSQDIADPRSIDFDYLSFPTDSTYIVDSIVPEMYYLTILPDGTQMKTVDGCLKKYRLNLTLYRSDTVGNVDEHYYDYGTCDSILWNGSTLYDDISMFRFDTTTTHGCDSVIYLDLKLAKSDDTLFEVSSCAAYTWSEKLIDDGAGNLVPKTYYHSLRDTVFGNKTTFGCDSMVYLNFTFLNRHDTVIKDIVICDSLIWNGMVLRKDDPRIISKGDTIFRTHTVEGCDSTVTIKIVNRIGNYVDNIENHVDSNVCDSLVWSHGIRSNIAGGTVYKTGVYYDTLTTVRAWHGLDGPLHCDSVLTLTLTVRDSTWGSYDTTVCDRFTWKTIEYNYPEHLYPANDTLKNANAVGCDSVVVLHFTSRSHDSLALVRYACDTFKWTPENGALRMNGTTQPVILTLSGNGTIATQDSAYRDTLLNAYGCDSIVYLNLTVYNHDSVVSPSDKIVACDSVSWSSMRFYSDTVVLKDNSKPNSKYQDNPVYPCTLWEYVDIKVNKSHRDTVIRNGVNGYFEWDVSDPYYGRWVDGITKTTGRYIADTTITMLKEDMLVKKTVVGNCDSTITLRLHVSDTAYAYSELYACDSIRVMVYNTDSTVRLLDTMVGCDTTILTTVGKTFEGSDSIRVTKVNIWGKSVNLLDTAVCVNNGCICPFDSKLYETDTNVVFAAGNYTVDTLTYKGAKGFVCDSVNQFSLHVFANQQRSFTDTVCVGTYTWHRLGGADTVIDLVRSTVFDTVFTYYYNNGCHNYDTLHLYSLSTYTEIDTCLKWGYYPAGDRYDWIYTYNDTISRHLARTFTLVADSVDVYEISTTYGDKCPYVYDTVKFTLHNNEYYGTTVDQVCDTFHWTIADMPGFDSVITAAGTYKLDGLTSNRCFRRDSLILNHVYHAIFDTIDDSICSYMGVYDANGFNVTLPAMTKGNTTTETRTNYDKSTSSMGMCDSTTTLLLAIYTGDTAKLEDIPGGHCGSYYWDKNDSTYYYNPATSGIVKDTHSYNNIHGCPSFHYLKVRVDPAKHDVYREDVCDSFVWVNHGETFVLHSTDTVVKEYKYTEPGHGECSSADTLYLTIRSSSQYVEDSAVCYSAADYEWYDYVIPNTEPERVNAMDSVRTHGVGLRHSEMFVDTVVMVGKNSVGCDSLRILNLMVNAHDTNLVDTTVCDKYQWASNGKWYVSDTNLKIESADPITNCSRIDTLSLVVVRTDTSTTDVLEGAYSVVWHGTTYTETTEVLDSLKSVVSGCDSIVKLTILVHQNDTVLIDTNVCQTFFWDMTGQRYYRDTVVYQTYAGYTPKGVNRVAKLMLHVGKPVVVDVDTISCVAFDWKRQGSATPEFTISKTGIYYDTLTSIFNCDSVVKINAQIPVNGSGRTLHDEVCRNKSYTWHREVNGDTTYTGMKNATKYPRGVDVWVDTNRYVVPGIASCYSVDTLYLTVRDTSLSTDEVIDAQFCDEYVWQGITLNNIGGDNKAQKLLVNRYGCDSLARVNVTNIIASSAKVDTADACNYYDWQEKGLRLSQTGTYTESGVDVNNCPVVDTLRLTIRRSSNILYVRSACDSFAWSKTTLLGDGYSYRFTATADTTIEKIHPYVNNDECASVDTLRLTLYASTHNVTVDSICQGATYRWTRNERSYQTATDTIYRYGRVGTTCKNVDTLHLYLYTSDTVRFDSTVCDGVTWHDNHGGMAYLTAENDYLYNYQNVHNCKSDSIMTLYVVNSFSQYDTMVRCDTIDAWVAKVRSPWNTWSDTAVRFSKVAYPYCDSVYHLHYYLNHPYSSTTYDTACDTYTWVINEDTQRVCLNDTNLYEWDVQTGCGRVDTLFLKLNISKHSSDTISACGSYHWDTTNRDYEHDTVVLHNYTDENNCASTSQLVLSVYPEYKNVVVDDTMACDQFVFGEHTYTQTTNSLWPETFKTIHDCDSVVTVKYLKVNNYKKRIFHAQACDQYPWWITFTDGGRQLRQIVETGQDTVVIGHNADGCDSIHILNAIIYHSDSSTHIYDTVCDITYAHGHIGLDHSLDTTFLDHTTHSCDSIVSLHLVVNYSNAEQLAKVNACDSFRWNLGTIDTLITRTGSYEMRFANIYGCDSVITLPVDIYHNDTVITNKTVCDYYHWSPSVFLDTTLYETTDVHFSDLKSTSLITGCHPVYDLHLVVNHSDTTVIDTAACDVFRRGTRSYLVNTTINEFGRYSTVNDCDSSVVINVTINHPSYGLIDTAECDTMVWGRMGLVFTESTVFYDTIKNNTNCDSILTISLTINHGSEEFDTATDCTGRYVWRNGRPYIASGDYSTSYVDQNGCISNAYLHLNMGRPSGQDFFETACDSFAWVDGRVFYSPVDTATYHMPNASGCDSLLKLHLMMNYGTYDTTTLITCEPYKWSVNNMTYDHTGLYQVGFTNINGCPSLHVLNYVNNAASSELYYALCDSVVLPSGKVFYEDEVYEEVYPQYNGGVCDSVATFNITVYKSTDDTMYATACDTFHWDISGMDYTRSRTLRQAGRSVHNCDSSYTLVLTINNSVHSYIDTIVEGIDCEWNDMYIVDTGSFDYSDMTVAGCDSIVTLHVSEFIATTRPKLVRDSDGKLLMVNHYPDGEGTERVDYYAYRWYKDGRLMYGANNDMFSNSDWSVLVGCYYVMAATDEAQQHWVRSETVCLGTQGIDEAEAENIEFVLYPNPAKAGAQLTLSTTADIATLQGAVIYIFDLHGREVSRVDVSGQKTTFAAAMPSGVYSLRLVMADGRTATRHIVVK